MSSDIPSTTPIVSVVLIFYNAERFIDEAIASVRAQTYPYWELLLVDDGSTDASAAIATRHAQDDPTRIRLLAHPGHENRGMSASRNLAIAHARGEYVAVIDADDIIGPAKLEQQVAQLEAHPEAGAVYGCMRFWYNWPGNPWRNKPDRFTRPPVPNGTLVEPPKMFVVMYGRAEGYYFQTTSFLARRSLVDQVGGFEDAFRSYHEDTVFHIKLFLNATILVSDSCWGWYRQHTNSATRHTPRSLLYRLRENVRFTSWMSRYVSELGIQDPEILDIVHQMHAQNRTLLHSANANRLEVAVSLVPYQLRTLARPTRERLQSVVGRVLRRGGEAPANVTDGAPFTRSLKPGLRTPVDRYYAQRFLGLVADAVQGRVLEIGDGGYTRRFGGGHVVESVLIEPVAAEQPSGRSASPASRVGETGGNFDCVIYPGIHDERDIPSAIRAMHQALKPGGSALLTFPGHSQGPGGWTVESVQKLLQDTFPPGEIEILPFGNAQTIEAFRQKIPAEALEWAAVDERGSEDETLLIGVSARKAE